MSDQLDFLKDLRNRLIRINGNDLVNKKLTPGGTAGTIINIINEVPTFIVDEILEGKSFVLDPLKDDEDYLKDENSKSFNRSLLELLSRNDKDREDISEDELRDFKNQVRKELKLPPIEEIIPRKNYDLDTVVSVPTHKDNKIQTDIPQERFVKFVKKICKSIDDYKREKGIDTCYLAVGFLRWNRDVSGQKREYNSPIFLVPLEIQEAKTKFTVESSGKDYGVNRILSPIFKQEIGEEFPEYIHKDSKESGIHDYLAQVDQMLERLNKEGWEFQHRMAIGHFKSTGIPLEELDPEGYSDEKIEMLYTVAGKGGVETESPQNYKIDTDEITSLVPYTVIQADSSQYSSMVDVAKGKNLVLEGPPGTGKSQTIVNILANAIHHDKKVLFLAQKTAALNVVYTRMQEIGLDSKCMPLHSEYSNKKSLFEKVGNLIQSFGNQSKQFEDDFEKVYRKYTKERDDLNKYCEFLGEKIGESGLTSQQILTDYALMEGVDTPSNKLDITKLSRSDRESALSESEEIDVTIEKIGRDLVRQVQILKSTATLDRFQTDDFFSEMEILASYFESRAKSDSDRSLADYKEQIEKNKKKLSLALEIKSKTEDLNTNYVEEEIPSIKELCDLRSSLSEASKFAKMFFPKIAWCFYPDLYRVVERIRAMIVDKAKSYEDMIKVLDEIETLLKDISRLNSDLLAIGGEQTTVEEIQSEVERLSKVFTQDSEKMKSLENLCNNRCDNISFDEIYRQIVLICEHRKNLNDLIRINNSIKILESKFPEISDFVEFAVRKEVFLRTTLESSILKFLARSLSDHFPNYKDFSGDLIQKKRKRLANITKELDEVYCEMIRSKSPKGDLSGNEARKVRDKTGITLLRYIQERPNSRVTVRELMIRAGKTLQSYAPCFLMTPSSVADFLVKEFDFDLLVIDEASQMLVEEAAGSMLRSKQYVVVGDSKQMPPTNYMVSTLNPEDIEEEKNESILERASASFTSKRRLLYHYRSQHESLIQFSNAEFYNNELMIIPSQLEKTEDLGIQYIYVDGEYNIGRDNAGNSTNPNPKEAKRIVDDICEFMSNPDNKDRSLGVAALNLRQSQRIEELMYEKISSNLDVAEYIDYWKNKQEYFFIKNLESVQGDERDVIMISTVFGRNKDDKVVQRFGPINQEKGEKRINVLITRAKQQLKVYTSLKPNDITSLQEGPQVLSRYLLFAETGILEKSRVIAETGTFDSPWERWFYERLTEDGYEVTPQVGVSGWRIDLGVKHSSYPYGYLCGIELDGAAYHSSRYARERDHLRQSILESQGWKIIRVWSTDFFSNKEEVYKDVKRQIESLASSAQDFNR